MHGGWEEIPQQCQKLFYRGTSDFGRLCRKYGLSVIQTNQGKAMHYAKWKAEAEGKSTWRTAIRMDIREAIGVSFFLESVCQRNGEAGLYVEAEPEVPVIKDAGDGAIYPSAFLGKRIWGDGNPGEIAEDRTRCSPRGTLQDSRNFIMRIYIRWGGFRKSRSGFPMQYVPISEDWTIGSGRWNLFKKKGSLPGKSWQHTGSPWRNRYFP